MCFDRFLLAVESHDLSQADKSIIKESTETFLLELTPYKGLCIVVCLLNGQ